MITELEITKGYELLETAIQGLYEAGENETGARATLETRRLAGLADGTIEGKNADQREASARQVLEAEYLALEHAERTCRSARLVCDLARLEVERVRAQLRLAELLGSNGVNSPEKGLHSSTTVLE